MKKFTIKALVPESKRLEAVAFLSGICDEVTISAGDHISTTPQPQTPPRKYKGKKRLPSGKGFRETFEAYLMEKGRGPGFEFNREFAKDYAKSLGLSPITGGAPIAAMRRDGFIQEIAVNRYRVLPAAETLFPTAA